MLKQIIQLIEQYDTICIYRHILPDGDAKGSQFGMKSWIQNKFPNKNVYAIGDNTPNSFFPDCDVVDIDYSKALAIVVDTSNKERICGEGWDKCDKIIKIDHHPVVDSYGDINIEDVNTCAACEVIGQLFMDNHEKLTLETATYLYAGLVADSQRLSIPTTTARSLRVGAYLLEHGVDVLECNLRMFAKTKQKYDYESYLRTKTVYLEPGLAYTIATMEDYEKFGFDYMSAKDAVGIMAFVKEFEVWVLYNEQAPGKFAVNYRSNKTVVNDIAAHFGGGGHAFAAGAKELTYEQIQENNELLVKRLKETR